MHSHCSGNVHPYSHNPRAHVLYKSWTLTVQPEALWSLVQDTLKTARENPECHRHQNTFNFIFLWIYLCFYAYITYKFNKFKVYFQYLILLKSLLILEVIYLLYIYINESTYVSGYNQIRLNYIGVYWVLIYKLLIIFYIHIN